ncbi:MULTISPECIES: acyltransferase family protein [Staphylococcus]|uniref:Acyltransferase n=1 Tax=Staphylococcus cohnii subsp. cohnii TaxID=74704 RepID=A0A0M2NTA5_STACC|nr:acyltransferase family protein [Staphylococcus cohnii]KKI62956.1 Acyltransferase [Staphylococcus cohnii subsp. cohnii]
MESKELKRNNRLYNKRYLPGLDGFRAIAVTAIIIFHMNPNWLPGGFLGVDTFFVISGYLITALLISEYYITGEIDLINFWLRRIKRLIPAVLFMLTVILTYTAFFKPEIIFDIKKDTIAAFFYVSNWWYIFQDVDYFNQFAIAPLKHLWSLAVEEQFYLLYPILLLFLVKFKNQNFTFLILFIISLISLEMMFFLSNSEGNNSRVYFGTDTRLQTLLLGALLAIIWPPFSLKKNISKIQKYIIDLFGIIGLVILIYFFVTISDKDIWIYKGGFYLISFITLFIIASVVHPSGLFAKSLSNRLFVYIGKRSYSLYLWHFPIIEFVHSYFVAGQIPFYVYFLDIILMVTIAEFSYKFIETPIRKKGIKAFALSPFRYKKFIRTAILILLLIPTFLLFNGNFDKYAEKHEEKKETSFTSKSQKNNIQEEKNIKEKEKQIDLNSIQPLLLGDSVMVDIGNVFQNKVPNAVIDGKVGRQLIDANQLIDEKYSHYSYKNQDVILELGTNGDFTESQFNQLIKNLGEANIYLVTVRVPKEYEQNVNNLIHKAGEKYKNVHVIDWHKESEDHPEYFAYDGIHLEYDGAKALSNLIIEKLKSVHKRG